MARRIAVVLFNLGGPDKPENVRPFLRNLFRDPAIIGAPGLIREFLAWLISTTRTKEATENYAKMGGGSPIVPETEKQAQATQVDVELMSPEGGFALEQLMELAGLSVACAISKE